MGDNFSAQFYDQIPKVWLTPLALQELDRRRRLAQAAPSTGLLTLSRDIKRFARQGGPDLGHIRGFKEGGANNVAGNSPPVHPSFVARRVLLGEDYSDANFQEHLEQQGIYLPSHPNARVPANLARIQELLLLDGEPELLYEANEQHLQHLESTYGTMDGLISLVASHWENGLDGPTEFDNFEAITSERTVLPFSSKFDGANFDVIDENILVEISRVVIPAAGDTQPTDRIAPNFFLAFDSSENGYNHAAAATGNDVDWSVYVMRHACYIGAYGARALHSLQNWQTGQEPVYDGQAYTFTAIYHGLTGMLSLFAHSPTAPEAPGRRPEYHMALLGTYDILGSVESLNKGINALICLISLAKRYRDRIIEAANARA